MMHWKCIVCRKLNAARSNPACAYCSAPMLKLKDMTVERNRRRAAWFRARRRKTHDGRAFQRKYGRYTPTEVDLNRDIPNDPAFRH